MNIVFNILVQTYKSLQRSEYDTTNVDTYQQSIHKQLTKILTIMKPMINKMFSHTCNRMDIMKCDPNEPMFHVK